MNDEIVEQEQEQPQNEPETAQGGVSDAAIIEALTHPSEAVQQTLNALIDAAVKKALAGSAPKRQTVKSDPMTPEQFAKLTYKQRVELFQSNRPLYEKMKGMI